MKLTHLDRLEAEAIFILRETAAQFRKPVLLYSIGKDSGCLLHLAAKAFYPGKPPFPLMHIDSTWEFKETIAFRDWVVKHYGVELLVYRNEDGVRQGINPFDHGSSLYTEIMRTTPLKQAITANGFDAAIGGARPRRRKITGQGARVLGARCQSRLEPEEPTPRNVGQLQWSPVAEPEHAGIPDLQLDGTRRLALHTTREYPAPSSLLRGKATGRI